MRMMASEVNQVFLTFLGNMVTNPLHHGNLHLPAYIHRVSTVDELCYHLYPQSLLDEAVTVHNSLGGKAILAFRNDTVNDFNDVLVERMPGV